MEIVLISMHLVDNPSKISTGGFQETSERLTHVYFYLFFVIYCFYNELEINKVPDIADFNILDQSYLFVPL